MDEKASMDKLKEYPLGRNGHHFNILQHNGSIKGQ